MHVPGAHEHNALLDGFLGMPTCCTNVVKRSTRSISRLDLQKHREYNAPAAILCTPLLLYAIDIMN